MVMAAVIISWMFGCFSEQRATRFEWAKCLNTPSYLYPSPSLEDLLRVIVSNFWYFPKHGIKLIRTTYLAGPYLALTC